MYWKDLSSRFDFQIFTMVHYLYNFLLNNNFVVYLDVLDTWTWYAVLRTLQYKKKPFREFVTLRDNASQWGEQLLNLQVDIIVAH